MGSALPLLGRDFGANVYLKMGLTLKGRDKIAFMHLRHWELAGRMVLVPAYVPRRLRDSGGCWNHFSSTTLFSVWAKSWGRQMVWAACLDARWLCLHSADESSLCLFVVRLWAVLLLALGPLHPEFWRAETDKASAPHPNPKLYDMILWTKTCWRLLPPYS